MYFLLIFEAQFKQVVVSSHRFKVLCQFKRAHPCTHILWNACSQVPLHFSFNPTAEVGDALLTEPTPPTRLWLIMCRPRGLPATVGPCMDGVDFRRDVVK